MDISLELSQKQILSQHMVQSMEILQMSAQELENYLEVLSLENPVIELDTPAPVDTGQKETDLQRKLDWLESTDLQNRVYYQQEREAENREANWHDITQNEEDLHEYLLSQLLLSEISDADHTILKFMIESLDSRGYFVEDTGYLASLFHTTEKHIEKLLSMIQSLDPSGVGARDLKECLLIQLNRKTDFSNMEDDSLVETLIRDHMDDIAKNHLHDIAKKLQVTQKEILAACEQIRNLNPKPGSSFSSREQLRYIIPDVIIVKLEDTFEILINEYQYPSFSISGYYKHLMDTTNDDQAKEYLQKKVQQAEWVQSCISQRTSTLKRVVQVLVEKQYQFFQYGIGHKSPLRLTDIAQELNLHESTISRALRGKYLQCSWGVFPLNYFLASIATKNSSSPEDAMTPEHVKAKIRHIIDTEDKKKPFSDKAISDKLIEMGIEISRRTVNKYRQEMGLPDKSGRKEWE